MNVHADVGPLRMVVLYSFVNSAVGFNNCQGKKLLLGVPTELSPGRVSEVLAEDRLLHDRIQQPDQPFLQVFATTDLFLWSSNVFFSVDVRN